MQPDLAAGIKGVQEGSTIACTITAVGAQVLIEAAPLLAKRNTVTIAVVVGFLRFSKGNSRLGCYGLKSVRTPYFIEPRYGGRCPRPTGRTIGRAAQDSQPDRGETRRPPPQLFVAGDER